MRSPRHHRLAGAIAGLGLLLSIAAPAVLAKEGVEVALAAPISSDAKPGDVVAVFFTLAAITDAGTRPLQGSDVFIRLYGPTGAQTQAPGTQQRQAGLYKAMIEIPAGGAARAEFGLRGYATDANGKVAPSDMIWPYDGILVAAAVPPAPMTDPATGTKPAPAVEAVPVERAPAAQTQTQPGSAAQAAQAAPVIDAGIAGGVAVLAGLTVAAAFALGRRRLHRSAA
jgi:hypothetical protein